MTIIIQLAGGRDQTQPRAAVSQCTAVQYQVLAQQYNNSDSAASSEQAVSTRHVRQEKRQKLLLDQA